LLLLQKKSTRHSAQQKAEDTWPYHVPSTKPTLARNHITKPYRILINGLAPLIYKIDTGSTASTGHHAHGKYTYYCLPQNALFPSSCENTSSITHHFFSGSLFPYPIQPADRFSQTLVWISRH
jgi:hypothetical protein